MDVKLQPLGKRVLVKPQEREEKTKGGLYIPDTASDDKKPSQGTVVKLGITKKEHKFSVSVGDTVYFKKYSPEEVEIDGEKMLIIDEEEILAIVELGKYEKMIRDSELE